MAYLIHRSIIFDSCIILGMLIKGVTYQSAPYLIDFDAHRFLCLEIPG